MTERSDGWYVHARTITLCLIRFLFLTGYDNLLGELRSLSKDQNVWVVMTERTHHAQQGAQTRAVTAAYEA